MVVEIWTPDHLPSFEVAGEIYETLGQLEEMVEESAEEDMTHAGEDVVACVSRLKELGCVAAMVDGELKRVKEDHDREEERRLTGMETIEDIETDLNQRYREVVEYFDAVISPYTAMYADAANRQKN